MAVEQLIVAFVVVAAVGFGVARTIRIIPQATAGTPLGLSVGAEWRQ